MSAGPPELAGSNCRITRARHTTNNTSSVRTTTGLRKNDRFFRDFILPSKLLNDRLESCWYQTSNPKATLAFRVSKLDVNSYIVDDIDKYWATNIDWHSKENYPFGYFPGFRRYQF